MDKEDKVFSFSKKQTEQSSKQKRSTKGQQHSALTTELPYEDLNIYKNLLELQTQLLDELFNITDEMLKKDHFQADKFVLNKFSAEEFLDMNMKDFVSGEDGPLDLMYDAEIDGEDYKALASAVCIDNEIEINALLCKYDGESWLAYTGDDWELVPDELGFYLSDY